MAAPVPAIYLFAAKVGGYWMPAFAGMTMNETGLFGAEDKGPIRPAAFSLGHRNSDCGHIRTQQVGPMPGALLQKLSTSPKDFCPEATFSEAIFA